MSLRLLAACVFAIALAVPCMVLADEAPVLNIEKIDLYPIDKGGGGRVHLKSAKAMKGDPLTIELRFNMSQWGGTIPATDPLKVQGPLQWTTKVYPDAQANVDPNLRTVTIALTAIATEDGENRLSYQMPSGGWGVAYEVTPPDLTKSAATGDFDLNGTLTIQNASGLKWQKGMSCSLLAAADKPDVLLVNLFSNPTVDLEVAESAMATIRSSGKLNGTFGLSVAAATATNPLSKGDLKPDLDFTVSTAFPGDKVVATVTFKGLNKSTTSQLDPKTAFALGSCPAAIQVQRTESISPTGLLYGTLLYRNAATIVFTNPLKAPVKLKGVCERTCCSVTNEQTLSAADKVSGTLTVQFKESAADGKPREQGLNVGSGWSSADIDKIVTVLDHVPASSSGCMVPCLQSDVALIKKELQCLSAAVGAIDKLKVELSAAQTASNAAVITFRYDPNLRMKAESDRRAFESLATERKRLIDRYNSRVMEFVYQEQTACDLAPNPQPMP